MTIIKGLVKQNVVDTMKCYEVTQKNEIDTYNKRQPRHPKYLRSLPSGKKQVAICFKKKILHIYPCVCIHTHTQKHTHTGKNSRRIYTKLLTVVYLWRHRIMRLWNFWCYISLFSALRQFVTIMHCFCNLKKKTFLLKKKVLGRILTLESWKLSINYIYNVT